MTTRKRCILDRTEMKGSLSLNTFFLAHTLMGHHVVYSKDNLFLIECNACFQLYFIICIKERFMRASCVM